MTDGPVLLAGLARLQFDPIWVKALLKTLAKKRAALRAAAAR